ncbi:MAG: DUF2290 domain-containing protein [Lactobacillaceae bacterium]
MVKSDIKKLEKEIHSLTSKLIECGITVKQNYPSTFQKNVSSNVRTCLGIKSTDFEMSTMLAANLTYEELYENVDAKSIYNFKLLDGALINLYYEFNHKSDLIKHRLTFFPSTQLLSLESERNPDFNQEDDIYSDIISENIYPTPIRFDYDPTENGIDHTSSHLTIGQYKNCRIPVNKPISPEKFLQFILKNFYYNLYKKNMETNWKKSDISLFSKECLKKEDCETNIYLNI